MLSKLVINNFKCLQKNVIPFKSLTFLVGGNGVGKSSVVQSLLLTKQSLEKVTLDKEIKDLEFEAELNGPYLMNLGYAKNILSSNADSNQINFNLINEFSEETILNFNIEETYGEHLLKGKFSKIDNIENIPFNFSLAYLNAERYGPRVGLPLAPNSNWDIGYSGEYASHLLFRADKNNRSINEDLIILHDSPRFSRQVEAWLQTIIPGSFLDYKLIDEINLASLKYKTSSLDTDFFPAPNTGFGISYSLPIIIAGLIQSIQRNGILIVENPEAHLHPLGQSKIGSFLAKVSMTGVQVIIETHSEHVINGARIEMAKAERTEDLLVNFFDITKGQVHIQELSINQVGELSEWPNGFFDQEQADLKELFKMKMEKR